MGVRRGEARGCGEARCGEARGGCEFARVRVLVILEPEASDLPKKREMRCFAEERPVPTCIHECGVYV